MQKYRIAFESMASHCIHRPAGMLLIFKPLRLLIVLQSHRSRHPPVKRTNSQAVIEFMSDNYKDTQMKKKLVNYSLSETAKMRWFSNKYG